MFLSALSSLKCIHWPLSLTTELLHTGCFLFFAPFSANSRDCFAWKSQETSNLWDSQITLAVWQQQSFHSHRLLDYISSPFWHLVWKIAEHLDHDCMLLCIMLLLHDWLIKYLHEQAAVQFYLIKCSLSVLNIIIIIIIIWWIGGLFRVYSCLSPNAYWDRLQPHPHDPDQE